MPNKNYQMGRNLEYRTRDILEDQGETVIRSAGSHGLVDLAAWNSKILRLVQIKGESARMTPAELEAFELMPVPPNAIKQIWHWQKVNGVWKQTVTEVKG